MDENIYVNEQQPSQEELKITQLTEKHLATAAKWAKFLAIANFICAGLVAIMALTAGSWMSALGRMSGGYNAMAAMGSSTITVSYLIAALISFLVALYLYRFATKTQQALLERNNDGITDAFGNLKSYFQLNGIILVIALAFMALGILIGIVGGIAAAAAF